MIYKNIEYQPFENTNGFVVNFFRRNENKDDDGFVVRQHLGYKQFDGRPFKNEPVHQYIRNQFPEELL